MSRRTRIAAVVAALSLVVAAAPAPAGAQTLDQSQTNGDGGSFFIFGDQAGAQTFTAGVTDTLDQVDLLVFRDASTTGALQVEIWATSGGLPTGPPLSSASVPAASVPVSPPGWVSVPLSGPPLLAGTQYAIVVYAPTSANGSFYWTNSSGNVVPPGPIDLYPAGELFFRPFGTGTFGGPFPPADFAFRTFVGPPAVTMPTSKGDCKEGGWGRYGVFKNQGDCVTWVNDNVP
jgi:hypothetical protein